MAAHVYMLLCADGSFYVGSTTNLERMGEHISGCSTYTSTRLPVELVWSDEFQFIEDAHNAERKLKGWSRAKKQALVQGDWGLIRSLSRRGVRPSRRPSGPPQDD